MGRRRMRMRERDLHWANRNPRTISLSVRYPFAAPPHSPFVPASSFTAILQMPPLRLPFDNLHGSFPAPILPLQPPGGKCDAPCGGSGDGQAWPHCHCLLRDDTCAGRTTSTGLIITTPRRHGQLIGRRSLYVQVTRWNARCRWQLALAEPVTAFAQHEGCSQRPLRAGNGPFVNCRALGAAANAIKRGP